MNVIVSKPLKVKKRKLWHLFFIALPLMMLVLMFNYVPLFGWGLSFIEYHPGTPFLENKVVGWKYFQMVFKDRDMIRVFKNTLIFAAAHFALLPLPMLFAVLLNEVNISWFRKAAQTMTTLPHFISWIIVFSMAFAVFSSDGLLNTLLARLGFEGTPTDLLTNADSVYSFQIAISTWKELGWSAIIYLASLASIDQELFEAAYIDGAGRLKTARYITIPGLLPTFTVLMLLSIANFVSIGFDQFFIFNNSMVYDNIEVIDLYAYRVGIKQFDYSYGTVIGIYKSLISLTLLFSVNALAKRVRGQSIV